MLFRSNGGNRLDTGQPIYMTRNDMAAQLVAKAKDEEVKMLDVAITTAHVKARKAGGAT